MARLSLATGAPGPLAAALRIANATMQLLTMGGVLVEPCPGGTCGGDGQIFKGQFVKHLSLLLQEVPAAQLPPPFLAQARGFFAASASSLATRASCSDGGLGFRWEGGEGGGCDVESGATSAAGLDLLQAAALAGVALAPPPSAFAPLGLGNCVDGEGAPMANCFKAGVDMDSCRAAAWGDPGAVAFDFHMECLGEGLGFCRVRTTSPSGACGGGFAYSSGNASGVSGGDGSQLTLCFIRSP